MHRMLKHRWLAPLLPSCRNWPLKGQALVLPRAGCRRASSADAATLPGSAGFVDLESPVLLPSGLERRWHAPSRSFSFSFPPSVTLGVWGSHGPAGDRVCSCEHCSMRIFPIPASLAVPLCSNRAWPLLSSTTQFSSLQERRKSRRRSLLLLELKWLRQRKTCL